MVILLNPTEVHTSGSIIKKLHLQFENQNVCSYLRRLSSGLFVPEPATPFT